jgi:pimeloyl-ACP methyl ester carboxylesterase
VSRRLLTPGLIAAIAILSCVVVVQRLRAEPPVPPMPTPVAAGFAPVNGIRMYYASYGSGSPVLLIHGGLASADVWANQVRPLVRAGYRVIVADSRGQGRSTWDGTPIGYDLMASDYLALLDYLKIAKVAVVGWSDGGIIGLDLAIHHPERLTRLFAQGANASVDGVADNLAPDRGIGPFLRWVKRGYDRLFGPRERADGLTREIAHMWRTEPNWTAEDLRAITTPTAIVLGDRDTAITRAHTDYMAETIPDAELIILPGVGHLAMIEDPKEYNRAVLRFLDGT